MSTPAITPQGVPMFGPDGAVHMVPPDQVQSATASGGEMAHSLTSPTDGSVRYVRHSQLGQALQAGGVPVSMVAGLPDYGQQAQQPSTLDNFKATTREYLGPNLPIGFAKGMAKTAVDLSTATPKAVLNLIPQARPAVQTASDAINQTLTPSTPGQKLGAGLETAGELAVPAAELVRFPWRMAANAGTKFDQVAAAVGPGDVVDTQAASSAATRGGELASRGGQPAKPLADFTREVVEPGRDNIPFQEGRDFYNTAGKPSIMERLQTAGPMKRQVAMFREGLGQALQDAADAGNVGPVYQAALAQYRKAMVLQNAGKVAAGLAAFEIADQIFGGHVTRIIKSAAAPLIP